MNTEKQWTLIAANALVRKCDGLFRSAALHEKSFRRERNWSLGDDYKFKLPLWQTLEVYNPEGVTR